MGKCCEQQVSWSAVGLSHQAKKNVRKMVKFSNSKCPGWRSVFHSPRFITVEVLRSPILPDLDLRSFKRPPRHLFTILGLVCKFTRRLKIFHHYPLVLVPPLKQIESRWCLILTVIDETNCSLIVERLTRTLKEENKPGKSRV